MKQQFGTQEKQRANKSSSLLSQDENELLFSLLGRRCQTMCTAVVQLYTTEPAAHSAWIRRLTGVLCFVRDSSKRSYFMRVYCLLKNELIWEEEMYERIIIHKSRDYLLNFEGRDCMIALSFVSELEANQFYKTATSTIASRTKRRQERRSRKISPLNSNNNSNQKQEADSAVMLRNPAPTTMQFSQMPAATPLSGSTGGLRDKKRSNRKLTKADISMPTNFKHVVHVGWTAQKGFDLNGEEVSNLNAFLEKAGVSEQQLNDRDTRAFIYDFIQSNNVLDSVKHEKEQHEPPPVPSRHQNGTQRTAPPPPPPPNVSRTQPTPSTKPQRGAPPSRPPPISTEVVSSQPTVSAAVPPPPPPPPPPPMMMVQPPPAPVANISVSSTEASIPAATSGGSASVGGGETRNALMDSIRKGTTLKKVDHSTLSTGSGGDARNDLLSEIRQGVELRPAGERALGERDTNSGAGTDALADALRRALLERGKALRSSDDSDSDTDNGEWDD